MYKFASFYNQIPHFRSLFSKKSFIDVVNCLYVNCFIEFMRIWEAEKCTIVDFGRISTFLKKKLKHPNAFLVAMPTIKQRF